MARRPRRERLLERLQRAASSWRCASDNLDAARRAGEDRRRGRAHRAAACATSTSRSRPTTRSSTWTPTREKAGLVGVTARDAGADDAGAPRSATSTRRACGSIPQRSVVLRRHLLRRQARHGHCTRSRRCPARVAETARPVHARRLRRRSRARRRPRSPSSATTLQRAAARLHADRGARHRQRRCRAREEARRATRGRAT